MKKKHFYAHLIEINDITLDLGDLDMSAEERLHLLSLLEANVHTTVMHTILSELPTEEKKVFLNNLVIDDHNKIWEHLKFNSIGLEDKIISSVNTLVVEMRKDINSVKKSK